MSEHYIKCQICESPDVKRINKHKGRDVYQCNMCVWTWTDYHPHRALPATEHQLKWLSIRGIECDGSRGHASDIIGDRVPWRAQAPTEAQRAWFAEQKHPLPETSGEAAAVMYYAYWGMKKEDECK